MMYQQHKLGASDDGKYELYGLFNTEPPPQNQLMILTQGPGGGGLVYTPPLIVYVTSE